jgi:DnaK suppressor protein
MRRRKTSVEQERYETLKAMLEDRRRDIHERLRSIRESLPVEAAEVRDTEEQSVDAFVQHVDFALMQMKSDTLCRIDEAIQRLDEGRYGKCADCDRDISAARLRALPFAGFCRDCQEQRERTEAEERAQAGRAAVAHALMRPIG